MAGDSRAAMRHLAAAGGVLADMLLKVVFPPRCVVCSVLLPVDCRGRGLGRNRLAGSRHPGRPSAAVSFDALLAPHLCRACHGQFGSIDPPLCPMCGGMFKSRQDTDHLCGDCIRQPKHFGMARAAGQHSGTLAVVIHRFKYEGVRRLAAPLGEVLFQAFRIHWRTRAVDCIVPMPLHHRRLRQRKFNQVTRLLEYWPRLSRAGDDAPPAWSIATGVLERRRHTPPQAGLNRRQRLRNIKNAFAVRQPQRVAGKHVLLVDDVYTTGATVNECAKALMKGGAEQVDVLTLARA